MASVIVASATPPSPPSLDNGAAFFSSHGSASVMRFAAESSFMNSEATSVVDLKTRLDLSFLSYTTHTIRHCMRPTTRVKIGLSIGNCTCAFAMASHSFIKASAVITRCDFLF
jgi:hypothetical protein